MTSFTALDVTMSPDVRVHPPRGLASFFIIAFTFSWLIWWVGPLINPEPSATLALVIAGSFGPGAAATAVTAALEGRRGLKGLFGRYLPGRQGGKRPYLVSGGIFLVLLGSGGIAVAAGMPLLPEGLSQGLLALPGTILLIALAGGGNEELGWRGFALPRLQAAMPPVASNVMLGMVWALWHAPLWSMATSQSTTSFPIYVVFVVGITIVLGFVFNLADGGLLAVVIAHTAVNAAGGLKASALGGVHQVPDLIAIAVIALVILIVTTGRLGLPHGAGTAPYGAQPRALT